jgi:4-amino-4-deoxy-L-arabinose transferase-like glycosyltransferase
MKPQLILLICIAIGIILFILSIIMRKRRKPRRLLQILGALIGILPVLLWVAFSLFLFIKERKYIGNYEGETHVQGIASLDMFDDNTFIMRSDSCTMGFVQGTWEYSYVKGTIVFESTSQNMGSANLLSRDSMVFSNTPVCIRLAREIRFGKTGKPVTIPVIEDNSDQF